MRILFVAPTPPVPTSGGRSRLYNLIKQLSVRHEVSVLSLIQPDEYDLLETIKPHCQIVETVTFAAFLPTGKWQNRLQGWRQILFNSRPRYALTFPINNLRKPLRRLLASEQFDLVVLQGLYVVELADEIRGIPVILATENVESDIARRDLNNAQNGMHLIRDWLLWTKLRRYEQKMLRRLPLAIAVSDSDVKKLEDISPHTEVHLVPNGVDSQGFSPKDVVRKSNEIMFFGTLNYGPNADGITWFCREMLPQVTSQVSDARLVIIGKDPPERVKALGQLPGAELVGFVPDIRDRLWSSTLSIAPLRSGGGTRLKILESLAAGCPVVSTTVGAEGLDLVSERHLLIADSAEAFVAAVLRLLNSPDLAKQLADNGRQAVTQRYDWAQIALSLEAACVRAVQLGTVN